MKLNYLPLGLKQFLAITDLIEKEKAIEKIKIFQYLTEAYIVAGGKKNTLFCIFSGPLSLENAITKNFRQLVAWNWIRNFKVMEIENIWMSENKNNIGYSLSSSFAWDHNLKKILIEGEFFDILWNETENIKLKYESKDLQILEYIFNKNNINVEAISTQLNLKKSDLQERISKYYSSKVLWENKSRKFDNIIWIETNDERIIKSLFLVLKDFYSIRVFKLNGETEGMLIQIPENDILVELFHFLKSLNKIKNFGFFTIIEEIQQILPLQFLQENLLIS